MKLTPTQIEQKLQRMVELRSELFDLANEFALDDNGYVAGELHESCNAILRANKGLTEGVTPEMEDRQFNKWCDEQIFPVPHNQRAMLKELMKKGWLSIKNKYTLTIWNKLLLNQLLQSSLLPFFRLR